MRTIASSRRLSPQLPADPLLPRHQVEVVGLDVVDVPRLSIAFFSSGSSFNLQRVDDRLRNLVLDGEDVGRGRGRSGRPRRWSPVAPSISWAVIRTRLPALRTLPSSTWSTSSVSATSFTSTRLALEGEGGVAGDDRQRRHLRQVGDDVLGDAVAEIFLLGIAAHVDERQDADRRAGGCGLCSAGLPLTGAAAARRPSAQSPGSARRAPADPTRRSSSPKSIDWNCKSADDPCAPQPLNLVAVEPFAQQIADARRAPAAAAAHRRARRRSGAASRPSAPRQARRRRR